MNLKEIETRLAEIKNEISAAADIAAIDKLEGETKDLMSRKAELEAIESRKQTALDITSGKITGNVVDVRNTRTFDLSTMTREEIVASPEYRSAWLKNLQGKELTDTEKRTAFSAASAIPTSTWNQIRAKMEKISPILSKVTVTSIPSNLTIPVEGTATDAAWVAMGTAATDGADTLTSVTLGAYKLIKTVEIGADVSAMAIDAFESYLVDQLTRKIAKAVENSIINGTGSAQATGLALSGQITNTGTFTKLGMTYADLLTIIADLPDAGYRDNACFVMPSALFYSDVLPALTGKSIALDLQATEKLQIFSYPVILCDRLAADTIIFGDLSYYHWNWVQAPQITYDNSVGYRTGSTVYRALALADGKPLLADAFNKYTRSAS